MMDPFEEMPPELVSHVLRWTPRLHWPMLLRVDRRWHSIVTYASRRCLARDRDKKDRSGCVSKVAHSVLYRCALIRAGHNGLFYAVSRIYFAESALAPEIAAAAAFVGDTVMLRWLYRRGCPIDKRAEIEAAKSGHVNIIRWLFCRYPLDCAAMAPEAGTFGHLNVLQWIGRGWYTRYPEAYRRAAAEGHMDVLADIRLTHSIWRDLMAMAIDRGRGTVVKWLRTQNCLWDGRALDGLGTCGDVALAQWIYDNGGRHVFPLAHYLSIKAALNGHVDMLDWAHNHGCPIDASGISVRAASAGHLSVLQWIHTRWPFASFRTIRSGAVIHGNLATLVWAYTVDGDRLNTRERECDDALLAAEHGHLPILVWLHERTRGSLPMDDLFCTAARYGHVPVMQWAWTYVKDTQRILDRTYHRALHMGSRVDVLEWLHDQGHPWDESTHLAAVDAGRLDILEHTSTQGNREYLAMWPRAIRHGHLHVLKWIFEQSPPDWDAKRARMIAEGKAHEHIIEWLDLQDSITI